MPTSLFRRLTRRELRELLAPIPQSAYRGGSVVLLQWCRVCRAWMREGSAAAGRCVDCGAPGRADLQVLALREGREASTDHQRREERENQRHDDNQEDDLPEDAELPHLPRRGLFEQHRRLP